MFHLSSQILVTALSLAVPVALGLIAVLAFLTLNADRTNRGLAELSASVAEVRAGVKANQDETDEILARLEDGLARLDRMDRRSDRVDRRIDVIRDWLDQVEIRVDQLNDYLAGSAGTCTDLGSDFQAVSESLAEVSASLFGASNRLRLVANRYRGRSEDSLVDSFGEDVIEGEDEDSSVTADADASLV